MTLLMFVNKKLHKPLEERDNFLKEHPELQEFQGIIDAELAKAGDNQHNRMLVLQKMMRENLDALKVKSLELQKSVATLRNQFELIKKECENNHHN